MRIISDIEKISHFSSKNKPIAVVEMEEIFSLMTVDCYNGQLEDEMTLRKDINSMEINLATGPIYIKGVYPGDSICVEIIDIELMGNGVMPITPGVGILGDCVKQPSTKIIEINNSEALFTNGISLSLHPMIGIIGVTPTGEKIHCSLQGNHGGNLDTKEITIGSKVYLPVFVEGALLAIGDLHACMGDGEMSGTGVEVAGKVMLKISSTLGETIETPVIITNKEIIIVVSDKSFSVASERAALIAVNLIKRRLGLDFSDAYRLMSATCDLRISQIVNQLLTVKIVIPKYIYQK